jgi:hypothetical protein
MAGAYYQQLRQRWKPDLVRLLLIGESAPDPGQVELRFFYAPVLTQHDNLFRGVILALYGCSPGSAGDAKEPWLELLRANGVFLIDLVPYPVNRLGGREKSAARRAHVSECAQEAVGLKPAAVAVCHGEVFKVLSGPMRAADLDVIHDQPLRFPIGNWRESFAGDLRAAATAAGLRFDRPA